MGKIQKIAIYCGANPGKHPDYVETAQELGRYLGSQKITVVYGGTNVGLMGLMADSVVAAGGDLIGVIPQWMVDKGVAHPSLKERFVVTDFHERKAKMSELSDACIALPGGIGTMEEIFEAWTWSKLGFKKKPCGFLNVCGYYDLFERFFEQMVTEQFLEDAHYKSIMTIQQTPEDLLKFFQTYQHPDESWKEVKDFKKSGVNIG